MRCLLRLGLLASGNLWAAPILAQTTPHATLTATVGYSDNAFGAADDLPADLQARPKIATTYFVVSPGVALYHDRPNSQFVASYQRSYSWYLKSPNDNRSSDALAFAAGFDAGPRDRLGLTLGADRTTLSLLTLGTQRGPQNGANAEVVNVRLGQNWTHELSQSWRTLQNSEVDFIVPYGDQETPPGVPAQDRRYSLQLGTGVEYQEREDAHALLTSGTYFNAIADDPVPDQPDADRLVVDLAYRWRRDWSPAWSSQLTLGGASEFDLEGEFIVGPLGALGLYYASGQNWVVSLDVSRRPTVSLVTSTVSERDAAALGVTLFLDDARDFRLATGADTGREHLRDVTGARGQEDINFVSTETSFGWYGELLTLEARYQFFKQFGASNPTGTLRNITRNTVMLTLGTTLPPRNPPRVNAGPAVRVDGTDQQPFGTSSD